MTGRLDTSAEHPAPVRLVAVKIAEWINRLGEIWVEGQIAQLSVRPGVSTQFLTLRDTESNVSLSVTCARGTLPEGVGDGARVVIRARPEVYLERGSLSLRASEIRQVGIGDLLAAIERLKKLLAAEGLFASERKLALPVLPGVIGLITGRASAAERDVVENVGRRFPGARFRVENVAVQGPSAVTDIVAALRRLDADDEVDIIVVARGGGSTEDLLAFSNETLLRAVAARRKPVVSAIGHETDTPLLDLIADLAASTPTDAAKRIVPDLAEETRRLEDQRGRIRDAVRRRLDREAELMSGLPSRLTSQIRQRLNAESTATDQLRERGQLRAVSLISAAAADLDHVRSRVRALSPHATLERGYAVVTTRDGQVVRDPDDAVGRLRVRVAGGEFAAERADRLSSAP